MSWTLDIIIILIIGLTVFFAAKNGFVKTAISAVSLIIAIIITAMFARPVADILVNTPVADTIESATEEAITDMLLEGSHEVDALLEGKSDEFNMLITVAGFDKAELDAWYAENVVDEANAESMLAKKIAEPIIDIIAMLCAIVLLYFGSQIVLSILSAILNGIANLPVLRSCNKLLGILLGIVLAVVRVCLFCFVAEILIENSAFLGNDLISSLEPENTLLYRIFREIDIFSFFIS